MTNHAMDWVYEHPVCPFEPNAREIGADWNCAKETFGPILCVLPWQQLEQTIFEVSQLLWDAQLDWIASVVVRF